MSERTSNRRRQRKWFLRCTLAIFVIAVLLGLGISWHVAGELVKPRPRTVGDPPADFEAETVRIPRESGSVLAGWYAPRPDAKGAVLLLHGFRATRLQMLPHASPAMWAMGGLLVVIVGRICWKIHQERRAVESARRLRGTLSRR